MTVQEIAATGLYVIGSLGGGGAIVFGLSNYLGKVWADRALEKQRQKNTELNLQLTSQLGLITEERKHLLQLRQLEHQVRFAKLHEKRADVIAQIYEKLVEAEHEVKRLIYQYGRREPNKPMPAEEKLKELSSFFDKHRIYLPEQICILLGDFQTALIEPLSHAVAFGDIESYDPTFLTQKEDGFKQSRDAFQSKIPTVRKALEQEFRLLLGDKT